MVTRGMEFAGRVDFYELNAFSNGGKDIIFSEPTPAWKAMRKCVHSTIKMYDKGLDKIESVSMEVINEMVQEIVSKNGKPVDPKEYMYFMTMNIIASLLVGQNFARGSEYHKCFIELDEAFMALTQLRLKGALMDALPFLKGILDPIKEDVDRIDKATNNMYLVAKREAEKAKNDGYMDSLISHLNEAVEKGDLQEDNVRSVVCDLVIAGSLTTSTTMRGLINLLIHHPDIQKKLHAGN